MTQPINLQSTPDPAEVTRIPAQFRSGEATLEGILFTGRGGEPRPAVVVTGAWTTVKEQMAGTYARELAREGFAALAFDFTGWGQSGGRPRFREDPAAKTADIHAAADFLAGRSEVDPERIFGLGICASAGYMAAAVADHPKLTKLALVAPWLHDPKMAEAIYGGAEAAQALIARGRAAIDKPDVMVAASTTDASAVMYQAPYYTESDRGLISAYDNKMDAASWLPWLTYDAQLAADRLTAPTLIVCSEAAALPAGGHAFAERTSAPITERWLDGVTQFDFYDQPDAVEASVEAVVRHLR